MIQSQRKLKEVFTILPNIIPITDGQSHTNKKPSLYSYRPATDSALPVSRIGSTAQCNGMKVYSVGIKNLPTNYTNSNSSSVNYQLVFLNVMFYQDHLHIPPVETSLVSLLFFRNFNLALERIKSIIKRINFVLNPSNPIPKIRSALLYHPSIDTLYLYYARLTSKADYTVCLNSIYSSFIGFIFYSSFMPLYFKLDNNSYTWGI